ncbi:MAG: head-tail adaptor protein [Succinatimonas sp.]|nr:head-tail adaptor protein [Succinatimonas sp.]
MSVSIPRAGELTKQVIIFKRVDKPVGNVFSKNNDTKICVVRAKIEPVGGAVYWGSIQTQNTVTHRIWIRSLKNKTDVQAIQHSIYIKYKNITYRPVRVTDANGQSLFTLIEACELGDIPKENTKSLMSESLL